MGLLEYPVKNDWVEWKRKVSKKCDKNDKCNTKLQLSFKDLRVFNQVCNFFLVIQPSSQSILWRCLKMMSNGQEVLWYWDILLILYFFLYFSKNWIFKMEMVHTRFLKRESEKNKKKWKSKRNNQITLETIHHSMIGIHIKWMSVHVEESKNQLSSLCLPISRFSHTDIV